LSFLKIYSAVLLRLLFRPQTTSIFGLSDILFFFSKIGAYDRGYAHLVVSVARNVPFAGAKLPECTACPDLSGSASQ